ncbi:dTDP-4-dehydrorhamnose 3,5-epimerase family protein [Candidatus Woesebacteria bacterium]|nr:dTDP-4-dehydrorhamnose 3,5-epimerase family protein [Candidatus Woesebacteria bacterium]MCD8507109.1 dTDP-4-dehydrorhamnose 3,5-epimerase family protein [Candidatus Woesebacteria bacterium]MCD8526920.1 dTDP-4-dehydrorhamnose 3,5-epimerase family protein [Candidatus Woesebacteria bacterium]MCD8546069.1 dTDP-4-dehydrorhamnose 3,5-epimerase family protein [Candidatus Woesebacteria bacterium]
MQIAEEYKTALSTQGYKEKTTIDGVEILTQPLYRDDTGNFTEVVRLTDGHVEGLEGFEVRQTSLSLMMPGVIKAFHVHENQEDLWYVPPYNRIVANLVDLRADSPTKNNHMRIVLGGYSNTLLRIPAGIAHGAGNLWHEPQTLIYFVTNQFNPDQPDEHRLPWDFFGPEMWEVERG